MEKPNLSYIESMSAGDESFERKLINIIKQEFPKEKEIYFNNINTDNNIRTAEIVHKLKHKISILGLENGYKVAAAFENNLIEGKFELQQDFEAILQIMTNYLKQL